MPDNQTPQGTEDVNLGTENQPIEPSAVTQPKPEDTADFWKQKFADSSREANLLREAEAARAKAAQESTKEPTDSELRTAFPEWDTLSDFEKRMARDTAMATRLASSAVVTTRQLQEDRTWSTSIELAISSDQALQGKEHEFRQFASRPQYKGVPMDLLTAAFLQKAGAPSPTPRPTPRPGLETGTGGPKTPDKAPKTLGGEDLKRLRDSDPKAYAEYVKTHEIELD